MAEADDLSPDEEAIQDEIRDAISNVFATHGRMAGNWVLSIEQHDMERGLSFLTLAAEDTRTWQVAGLLHGSRVWTDRLLHGD